MNKFDAKKLNEKDALFFAPKLMLSKEDEDSLPEVTLDMAIKYLTTNDNPLPNNSTQREIHLSFVNQKRAIGEMNTNQQFRAQVVARLKDIDENIANVDEVEQKE